MAPTVHSVFQIIFCSFQVLSHYLAASSQKKSTTLSAEWPGTHRLVISKASQLLVSQGSQIMREWRIWSMTSENVYDERLMYSGRSNQTLRWASQSMEDITYSVDYLWIWAVGCIFRNCANFFIDSYDGSRDTALKGFRGKYYWKTA